MIFSIKETDIISSLRKENFPLFRFSKFLLNFFLVVFLFALALVALSFVNIVPGYLSLKTFVASLSFFLLFLNLDFFVESKIKNPQVSGKIKDAAADPENYNLAGFLNLSAAKIILDCSRFCKHKKIPLNSTALLYSAVRKNENVKLICFRLGLDIEKLVGNLKNYLEKNSRQDGADSLTTDFQETIMCALNLSVKAGREFIGEKDLLVALSQKDEFFKKVLVENDLKSSDVEDLTFWLSSAEDLAKKQKKFWSYENLLRKGSFGKDFSSGYTITLDRFSTDWRQVVSKWNYQEIIGHKREIEQTEVILGKNGKANVLIIGEAGGDRKSIVKAIAHKCFLGNSLPELNNKRVVELDPIMMAAQIPDFERLEATLEQIFSEVVAAGNVMLVIDNFENFVGQRVQKAGAFDISGILGKYLPIPRFQFIALTSYEGLHKNIQGDSALAELFDKVEISEISEAETIRVLQSVALELEYLKGVLILYPSIREIVNLTARYMPSLLFPKKALDVLDEAVVYVQRLNEKVVLPHHIAEIISKKTEIPVGKMEVKEKEVLLNLENLIHKRIVNQEEAVTQISVAMRRARMGLASKKRPMGTFLFLGPTGVGKTETAKALSEIYFGSEEKMIRIDMSEFQSIQDIQRLIGATSPVEVHGLLTTSVRETPFSLVLLDEIEKAHPNILNLFLQVLDEGHITDGQGRKVVFTNTIIICTSNAGADIIFNQVQSGQALKKDDLLEVLFGKNIFRPEFVNRFDATVIFHPLSKENLIKIAHLSLQNLQKNLRERDIEFQISESLKEKIVELSYKPAYGAREMRRVVQDKVESIIASALLSEKIKKGDRIEISPENFEIIVNPVN